MYIPDIDTFTTSVRVFCLGRKTQIRGVTLHTALPGNGVIYMLCVYTQVVYNWTMYDLLHQILDSLLKQWTGEQ